jgi:hypothetical protein
MTTDTHFDSVVIEKLTDTSSFSSQSRGVLFYKCEVFKMLTEVKKAAAGVEKLSY